MPRNPYRHTPPGVYAKMPFQTRVRTRARDRDLDLHPALRRPAPQHLACKMLRRGSATRFKPVTDRIETLRMPAAFRTARPAVSPISLRILPL